MTILFQNALAETVMIVAGNPVAVSPGLCRVKLGDRDWVTLDPPSPNTSPTQVTLPKSGKDQETYSLYLDIEAPQQYSAFLKKQQIDGGSTVTCQYYAPNANAPIIHYGLFDADGNLILDVGYAVQHYGEAEEANRLGSSPTFTLSGKVTTPTGSPVPGVTLTGDIDGTPLPGPLTTDSTGSYSVSGIPKNGSVTLTPAMDGFVFTPTAISENDVTQDITASNLVACPIQLNGTASWAKSDPDNAFTPLAGVAIVVTGTFADGTLSQTATSDKNGHFAVRNFINGNTYSIAGTISDYEMQPEASVSFVFDAAGTGVNPSVNLLFKKDGDSDPTIWWIIPVVSAIAIAAGGAVGVLNVLMADWEKSTLNQLLKAFKTKYPDPPPSAPAAAAEAGGLEADALVPGAPQVSMAEAAADMEVASVFREAAGTGAQVLKSEEIASEMSDLDSADELVEFINSLPADNLVDVIVADVSEPPEWMSLVQDLVDSLLDAGVLQAPTVSEGFPIGFSYASTFADASAMAAEAAEAGTGYSVASSADAAEALEGILDGAEASDFLVDGVILVADLAIAAAA